MCLGIPGQVKQIYREQGARMGKVNFGGIVKDVCLEYVPELNVGDYTIVHAGFALNLLSEEDAQETLAILREIASIEDELGPEPGAL